MLVDQAQGRSRTLYPKRCEGRWWWWWRGGLLCIQLSPSVSVPPLFYNSCSQTSGEAAPADTRLHKQSSSCVLSPCLTRSECFTGRRLGLGAPALMAQNGLTKPLFDTKPPFEVVLFNYSDERVPKRSCRHPTLQCSRVAVISSLESCTPILPRYILKCF